jgi:hypothetical protein
MSSIKLHATHFSIHGAAQAHTCSVNTKLLQCNEIP